MVQRDYGIIPASPVPAIRNVGKRYFEGLEAGELRQEKREKERRERDKDAVLQSKKLAIQKAVEDNDIETLKRLGMTDKDLMTLTGLYVDMRSKEASEIENTVHWNVLDGVQDPAEAFFEFAAYQDSQGIDPTQYIRRSEDAIGNPEKAKEFSLSMLSRTKKNYELLKSRGLVENKNTASPTELKKLFDELEVAESQDPHSDKVARYRTAIKEWGFDAPERAYWINALRWAKTESERDEILSEIEGLRLERERKEIRSESKDESEVLSLHREMRAAEGDPELQASLQQKIFDVSGQSARFKSPLAKMIADQSPYLPGTKIYNQYEREIEGYLTRRFKLDKSVEIQDLRGERSAHRRGSKEWNDLTNRMVDIQKREQKKDSASLPKAVDTEMTRRLISQMGIIYKMNEVRKVYRPIFNTWPGALKGKAISIAGSMGLSSELNDEQKQFVADFGSFEMFMNQIFDEYRIRITGAAAVERELSRLRKSIPNASMDPIRFERSFEDYYKEVMRTNRLFRKVLRGNRSNLTEKELGAQLDRLFMAGGDDDPRVRAQELKDQGIGKSEIKTILKEEGYIIPKLNR